MGAERPVSLGNNKKWMLAVLAGLLAYGLSRSLLGWTFNGSVVLGVMIFMVIWLLWSWSFRMGPAAVVSGSQANRAQLPAEPAVVVPVATGPTIPGQTNQAEPESLAPEPPKDPVPMAAAVAAMAVKPAMLAQARDNRPDDLTIIRGIGPKLEQVLQGMGVFHFDQIANWQASELVWMDANLAGFCGRASRDGWVVQAQVLARGGSEADAFAAADAMKG